MSSTQGVPFYISRDFEQCYINALLSNESQTVNALPLPNISRGGFERSDRLVENPQRPHEGGEDTGEGGGLLHQHVHARIVHVPADRPGGGLEGLQVGVSHVLHLGDQPACLTRGCCAQGNVPRDCTFSKEKITSQKSKATHKEASWLIVRTTRNRTNNETAAKFDTQCQHLP